MEAYAVVNVKTLIEWLQAVRDSDSSTTISLFGTVIRDPNLIVDGRWQMDITSVKPADQQKGVYPECRCNCAKGIPDHFCKMCKDVTNHWLDSPTEIQDPCQCIPECQDITCPACLEAERYARLMEDDEAHWPDTLIPPDATP